MLQWNMVDALHGVNKRYYVFNRIFENLLGGEQIDIY